MTDDIETVEYTLIRPLKGKDGEKIHKLTLREPDVSDMIKAEKFAGKAAYTAALISAITEIPLPIIHTMKPHDLDMIDRKVGELMGNSPRAGGETAQS